MGFKGHDEDVDGPEDASIPEGAEAVKDASTPENTEGAKDPSTPKDAEPAASPKSMYKSPSSSEDSANISPAGLIARSACHKADRRS
jgi:hypothetical protein